jgi:hypothetical protein
MVVDDESQLGDLADYGSQMSGVEDGEVEPVFRFEVPDIGDHKSRMPDLDDEDECEAPDIGSYDEFKEFVRQSGPRRVGVFRRLASWFPTSCEPPKASGRT